MGVITRKDVKNLLVAVAILFGALASSAVQAAETAAQKGKYGSARFIGLSGAPATNGALQHASNARFRSLDQARRSHVTGKAIPLYGGRSEAKLKSLADPQVAHRVQPYREQIAREKRQQQEKGEAVKKASLQAMRDRSIAPLDLEGIEPEMVMYPPPVILPPMPEAKPSNVVDVEELADDIRHALEEIVEELTFQWPVAGAYQQVSSPFGPRKHPVTGKRDFHAGIDIPAPKGTPVLAAAAGEVSGVGTHPRLGKYIKVTHGDGSYALYGHLHSWSVREGKRVDAGQVIGKVGSTGRSTGPHLDFSIRRDGKPVNPLPLLVASVSSNKKLAMLQ